MRTVLSLEQDAKIGPNSDEKAQNKNIFTGQRAQINSKTYLDAPKSVG